MFATRYQRHFNVKKLAEAPMHPSAYVFCAVLAAPMIATVLGVDRLGPGSIALLACELACGALLMEGDARLAGWPRLDILGDRLEPLVEAARERWRKRLRPWLLRGFKPLSRCLGTVLFCLIALAVAGHGGLTTGEFQPVGGLTLTPAGEALVWRCAGALLAAWLILLTIRVSKPPNLDLPELTPETRISGVSTRLPASLFAALRAVYFVGLPLLALTM